MIICEISEREFKKLHLTASFLIIPQQRSLKTLFHTELYCRFNIRTVRSHAFCYMKNILFNGDFSLQRGFHKHAENSLKTLLYRQLLPQGVGDKNLPTPSEYFWQLAKQIKPNFSKNSDGVFFADEDTRKKEGMIFIQLNFICIYL